MLKYVVIYLKLSTNAMKLRSFGNLIYDFTFKYNGIGNVKQLRKWEKLQIKVKIAELDLTLFCQADNVYPIFLAFNILHSNRTDDEAIRKRLLKSTINRGRKEHLKLAKDLKVVKGNLNLVFTSVDLFILNKAIHKICQNVVNAIVKTHHKKLQNLTKNEVLPSKNNEGITSL